MRMVLVLARLIRVVVFLVKVIGDRSRALETGYGRCALGEDGGIGIQLLGGFHRDYSSSYLFRFF